jgi:hypothetical protein
MIVFSLQRLNIESSLTTISFKGLKKKSRRNFYVCRATYPRLRFDQLITLCWCSILPITLAFFFLVPSILITFSLNSPPSLDSSSIIFSSIFFNLSSFENIKNWSSSWLKKDFSKIPVQKFPSSLIEWIVGFTDAEGHFSIVPKHNNTSFNLVFQLKLHRDFQPFLEWLKNSVFGYGYITVNSLGASLIITKFEIIESRVLPIFTIFSLNTKKYLDFCCWKEALYLKKQYNEDLVSRSIYIEQMLFLKSQMNKSRIDFSFPSHFQINITDYWLLGFTEGDGSFNYNPKNGIDYPRYSMKNRNESALAIEGVKSYLGIGITYEYTAHDQSNYQVSGIDDLCLNIYPLFSKLDFFTSKGSDFLYWSCILMIIRKGLHTTKKGIEWIKILKSNTNQRNLSTTIKRNNIYPINFSEVDLISFLSQPTIFNLNTSFREAYFLTKSFLIRVYDPNFKLIYTFESISAAARALNFPKGSISRRVDTHKLYNGYYFYHKEYPNLSDQS